MKKMLLLGSHVIIHLFFSFLLQITTLFLFFYVHNYIIFSSHLAQLPRRYGIDLAMLVEKNLHWLEKGFGGKHGSKHAEPRKREMEGKGREQECGAERSASICRH